MIQTSDMSGGCFKRKRQRHERCLLVRLTCGHDHIIPTGAYKVTKKTEDLIVNEVAKVRITCSVCKGKCWIIQYVGLVNQAEE